MSGILKVVATPIGNLKDISQRALEAFKEADAIFAEDTRKTGMLVKLLNVPLKKDCRFVSAYSQKEKDKISLLLSLLEAGKNVVLVSDAGSPGISDPGSFLVQAARLNAFKVEPIPGACAVISAIMASGLDCTRFAFLGFLPQKKKLRSTLITQTYTCGMSLVIFESPQRILTLEKEIHTLLGPVNYMVARELTKLFESFHYGVLGDGSINELPQKGEMVMVVERCQGEGNLQNQKLFTIDDAQKFFSENPHLSLKELSKLAKEQFQVSAKEAYEKILAIKNNLS